MGCPGAAARARRSRGACRRPHQAPLPLPVLLAAWLLPQKRSGCVNYPAMHSDPRLEAGVLREERGRHLLRPPALGLQASAVPGSAPASPRDIPSRSAQAQPSPARVCRGVPCSRASSSFGCSSPACCPSHGGGQQSLQAVRPQAGELEAALCRQCSRLLLLTPSRAPLIHLQAGAGRHEAQ